MGVLHKGVEGEEASQGPEIVQSDVAAGRGGGLFCGLGLFCARMTRLHCKTHECGKWSLKQEGVGGI